MVARAVGVARARGRTASCCYQFAISPEPAGELASRPRRMVGCQEDSSLNKSKEKTISSGYYDGLRI